MSIPAQPAMIAGCEAALDAGIYYQDEFRDFVLKHMGGLDCAPALVEAASLDLDAEDHWQRQKDLTSRLARLIKASPRGHYALIRRTCKDWLKPSYSAMVSDGSGKLAVGGQFDGYDHEPTGDEVLTRVIGYEIYLCRKDLEEKRRTEANIKAQQEHAFTVGMEFKDYRHPGETKKFAKAVIAAVQPDKGTLQLLLIRRGTSKRWEATMGAKRFAEIVGIRPPEADPRPFIVVVQNDAASEGVAQ
ncbi:MAG: hypothetical protein OEL20_04975 [Sulfuritalea sp.]|nr:hypothetical protein [Sulfuritalea sp.]